MKKPNAILAADFHMRDDQPIARTDYYWSAQMNKIVFIRELQKKYNYPIYVAGDIFNKAKSSPFLESFCLREFPNRMVVIPGQHDLLNHSIDNFFRSSIGVLYSSKLFDVYANPFEDMLELENGVGLIHTFIQKPKDKQDKIIGGYSARAILKKYPHLPLIVSGDNHKPFTYEYEGRLLVNPGSMMRMTAGQTEHRPRVYLWYADSNTVEPVYLPIESGVINREHIEVKEKREQRISAFVSRLDQNYELSMSFEKNMQAFIKKNKVRNGVRAMITEAIE